LVQWYALMMVGGILALSSYYFVSPLVWHWMAQHWLLTLLGLMFVIVFVILAIIAGRRLFRPRPATA
jgi:hypothetical protein